MTPFRAGRSVRRQLTATALIALVILMALPSLVAAAPSQRIVDTVHGTRPPRITTEAGSLDFFITFSDVGGAIGEMAYWEAGKVPGQEPGLHGVEGFTAMEGDTLVGEYSVFDSATGEFVGFATYSLRFTASGPPEMSDESRRQGNARTKLEILRQAMTVSGTFTLPAGTTFAIETTGLKMVFDTFTNEPASTVDSGSETFIRASWMVDGVEVIFSFIGTEITTESFVFVFDGGPEISGVAQPPKIDGHIQADYELERSGQIPVGSASVDLQVTTLGSRTSSATAEGYRERVTEDEIALSGSLSVLLGGESIELAFADAAIDAHQRSWHSIRRPIADDGGEGEG
jgi:hypothetical protein